MTEKTWKTPIRASEEGWIDLRDFNGTVFHGTAAHLAGKLVIAPASSKGIECRDLTDPGTLKELLDHYNDASFPGDDPRSTVSYWSQWYFGYLLPPLILLASAAKVYLPANLSAWRLILTDGGQPDRFILCDPFAQSAASDICIFDLTKPFLDTYLAPLIFSLAARSGVSAKVFWMNAAVVIDYTHHVLTCGKGLDLRALTESRMLPDGRRNPLFGPYRPSGSEATRSRRLCCLRYALDHVARCSDCSLKPSFGQDHRPVVLGASLFSASNPARASRAK